MALPVIGFCGYAEVGKDTAFKALEECLPFQNFRRLAFGDIIKADLQSCWDVLQKRGNMTGDPAENKRKFRPMWVDWGRIAREFDPNIWIDRLRPSAKALQLRNAKVAITDVRRRIEVDWVVGELRGLVFEVHRPGFGPANDDERTDMELIHQNYQLIRIVNDGSIEDFKKRVVWTVSAALDISATSVKCPICETDTRSELKACEICGKTVCPSCIIYSAPKGKYLCRGCKSGG